MAQSKEKNEWVEFEEVGVVVVDSGEIVITDPCYLNGPESEDVPEFGTIVPSTIGDGIFSVVAAKNENGAIVAYIIDMVPEGWEGSDLK